MSSPNNIPLSRRIAMKFMGAQGVKLLSAMSPLALGAALLPSSKPPKVKTNPLAVKREGK